MTGLSGWHGAIVHDHEPFHAASVEYDHDRSKPSDPDGPVHMLAHATGELIALAGPLATPTVAVVSDQSWSPRDTFLRSEIDPSELLRPPRG
ncbi:hypothetical protein [Sphingomonas sp. GB1N7]|uniref:hypothetical protein n=1 Tax=Parasphingomonas caseinilytica TaxID=3096158 RepID=UPI002FC7053C